MPELPRTQTEKYLYSSIMTAGKMKSVMLLINKARRVVDKINSESIELYAKEIQHCKNIVAQLEMSLNLKSSDSARNVFEIYELIYAALEAPTAKSIEVVKFLLKDFGETLEDRFGR